ncbi:hypothetical protein EXIGLDRAFT_771173 [Exidia glandulosa HHB12029]|uniref:F-box domain-containing protein n=1 Tax=Exidia glandulosa HHB12029 TaxID=1314781 RepID=A0A165G6D1_EXIGL|nr:hypothetical protein EXIGLDRAFT_771173 [Exidia glandulosa HHB12029]
MVHFPAEVVYYIAEELAAPSTQQRSDGRRRRFPLSHPALLPSALAADLDAAKNLRSCALVSKLWAGPARMVNIRHLDIWRATQDAIATALSPSDNNRSDNVDLYVLVRHFQAGRENCPGCRARNTVERARLDGASAPQPCANGVSKQTLLWTLSRCRHVRRVTVHEWDALDASVDFSTYGPFISITTFRLGMSPDASRRLALRPFLQLLRLLPSLKRLSVGDLSETDASISDIPTPNFQLESLGVHSTGDHGASFVHYDWLLANSSQTLHTFWVYGISDIPSGAACMSAIRLSSATLRAVCFSALGMAFIRILPTVLAPCAQLEELCLSDPIILPHVASLLGPHARLRKITISSLSIAGLRGRGVFFFFTPGSLRKLAEILAQPHNAFPNLEILSIEAPTPHRDMVLNSSMTEIRAVRAARETRAIAFDFSTYA